ncbi:MAG: hypothetical protein IJS94_04135, partial [Clostridia bacterium]|nr:hypothetical protein [Clostridia bacterium]
KWYDLDYREILSANIVLPNPANMTGLEVTYEETKYSFDVENTTYINDLQQEVVETKVRYDDKEMDNTRFNDYLDVITDLIRIDNCDLPTDDLTPEYTALLSYEKDDEKLTDELSVYKSSDGKYFAALNGKSEAYINAEYYEAFSRQLDRLVNGKDIENIATIYSESSDTASDASSGETSQQSEEPKD